MFFFEKWQELELEINAIVEEKSMAFGYEVPGPIC